MSVPAWPSPRARLHAGERLVGGLLRTAGEELVEMLAVAGFDFVLLDCEHGAPDLVALRHHVTAAQALGMPVLVRSGVADPAFVLRALDLGVQGLLAPHVDTGAAAEAIVRSVRYPPRGERGYAGYSRAGRYGTVPAAEHREHADDLLVLAMIESPQAVSSVADIVSVPGVDGYLVGTSDLGASRGPDDPPLPELVARTHRSASATGTLRADLASSAAEARAALDDGARLIVHNVTSSLMGLLHELRIEV